MLKSVQLINFFSFGDCTIELEPDLNVLVGINGSGKSNFLRAFQLLKAGLDGRLREQITQWGGYNGVSNKSVKEETTRLSLSMDRNYLKKFGANLKEDATYELSLLWSADRCNVIERIYLNGDDMIFSTPTEGVTYYDQKLKQDIILSDYQDDVPGELVIPKLASQYEMPELRAVARALRDVDLYRLFNTTEDAPMRTTVRATGVDKLLPNGDNMFQVLNTTGLKSTAAYDAIEAGLHDVNEHFQRFRMNVYGQGSVEFYLQEKGLETPIHAAQVSDGTLSYLCLLVALHQPGRGRLLVFDEPERNLHPDMLLELGKQLTSAGEQCQILLTTHAPGLLNQFPLRTVRVFEKDEHNQTQVRQFTEEDFVGWYEVFAPGQMWRDGALGGNRY